MHTLSYIYVEILKLCLSIKMQENRCRSRGTIKSIFSNLDRRTEGQGQLVPTTFQQYISPTLIEVTFAYKRVNKFLWLLGIFHEGCPIRPLLFNKLFFLFKSPFSVFRFLT